MKRIHNYYTKLFFVILITVVIASGLVSCIIIVQSYSGLLENAFFVYNGICYMDGIDGVSVGFDVEGYEKEWYKNVISSKKHYLGELEKSPITGLPVMISSYPILDKNQEILAVFGLSINLSGFSNTIIYNPESTSEETIIIDESGTVVAANDIGLIYKYNIGRERLPGKQ